jgi:ribosome maturation factor RimP
VDRETLIFELSKIAQDYMQGREMVLVDIICRYEGNNLILRILADRVHGGITLEECAELNKGIGYILGEKGIVQENYALEVSSPGLDRPLKARNDFLRCLKRKARFFFNQEVNGKFELEGIIDDVKEDLLFIQAGADIVEVPLSKINRAKQVF